MTNTVEREVTIQAPIGVVWDVVTKPEYVRQWFSEMDFEASPGATGAYRFEPGDGRDAVVLETVVDRAEAPSLLVLHWTGHPGEPTGDHPWTSVEFQLTSEGEATRLRVVETGFDAVGLSGAEADQYRAGHERGWAQFVGQLAAVAEAANRQVA